MSRFFNEQCTDNPLSDNHLEAYGRDYTRLYTITKNKDVLVYPCYTQAHENFGKAIIVSSDNATLIAKCSVNGKLTICDKELFDKYFKVTRLNASLADHHLQLLIKFFQKLGVFKSVGKFDLESFLNKGSQNAVFKSTRKDTFLLSALFGKPVDKLIQVSRYIVIGQSSFFEQVSFNVFKAFKVFMQPTPTKIRFDFQLRRFKGHAVVDESGQQLDILFKKMMADILDTQSIFVETDYIFTPEFFEYYEQIQEMINY